MNFCGKLSTDDAASVRLEFINAVGDWLQHLDERIDHQGRLLPYLLSALNDTQDSIQHAALHIIDDIGQLYEKDNEKDLKDIVCYLPPEAHNVGWTCVADVWHDHLGSHESGNSGDTNPSAPQRRRLFPKIFTARPRIGARRVVAANFPQIVKGILGELRGWQPHGCCSALKLLEVYAVYVEDWMQQHLHELLPALLQAVANATKQSEDTLALEIVASATSFNRMMGVFVPGDVVWTTIEPVFSDASLGTHLQVAAAEVLRAYAAGVSLRGPTDECLQWATSVLVDNALSDSQHAGLKASMVGMLQVCVQGASNSALQQHACIITGACLRLQAWPACKDEYIIQGNWDQVENILSTIAARLQPQEPVVKSLFCRFRDEISCHWKLAATANADVIQIATRRLGIHILEDDTKQNSKQESAEVQE